MRAYLTTFPGYYETGDAGIDRRGRLRLHHGPHRRRHQRRRPPAVDRRDGGGAGEPSGRRRMRGDRRRRRAEGPAADGLPLPEQGLRPRPRRRSSPNACSLVRDRIGPVAAFKTAVVVERLPKTRSGKILRGSHGPDRRRRATGRCRRRSTIRRSSARSAKACRRIGYPLTRTEVPLRDFATLHRAECLFPKCECELARISRKITYREHILHGIQLGMVVASG